MTTIDNDTDEAESADDIEMTRRAFGVGTFMFGTGTHILGYSTDRVVTPSWTAGEFDVCKARIHDENILNGYELYVFGRFNNHVSNEPVTVEAISEKGKRIKKKTFHVNGTAWRRIFGMWRFPDRVVFERQ